MAARLIVRHTRLIAALAAGLAAAVAARPLGVGAQVLSAIDAFSLLYVALMLHLATRLTPAALRRRAGEADEGVPFILFLALGVVTGGLVTVVMTIQGTARAADIWLALASVPLGWAMLQTVMAYHYARVFYGRAAEARGEGGLRFEGTKEPGPAEFYYYAATVGMTAQVSDTVTTTTRMRRVTLWHAVLSFFYNTVILALTVNAVISMGK